MKITLNGFVIWHKYDWEKEPRYSMHETEMNGCGPDWVAVKPLTVETEIPDDFDPRPQQIESLKAAKQEILAKAHVQATNLEEQIQKLLALEDKS